MLDPKWIAELKTIMAPEVEEKGLVSRRNYMRLKLLENMNVPWEKKV
jgi:hypothetical protein